MPDEHDEPARAEQSAAAGAELKNPAWELFILALSTLSIANLVISLAAANEVIKDIVFIVDIGLSIIFLSDFSYRLLTAPSKRGYLIRQGGWLDLVGSLPFPGLRIARLLRIARVAFLIRRFGLRNLWRRFRENLAGSTLLVALLLVIVLLEFGAIGVARAEAGAPDANIKSAQDAIWWGYVTMTTVGYGDRFPTTTDGRIVGVFVMTFGIAMLGVLTGFLANVFLSPKRTREKKPVGAESDVSARLDELEALLAEQQRLTAELRERLA